MGMNVLTEIGGLLWQHPYVSCSLLVFLTPPFFPILTYFAPLLISTALFIVALVFMGPQFEEPIEPEHELQGTAEGKVLEGKEMKKEEEDERQPKRQKSGKDRSTWSDWMKNYKDSGLAWVEDKLRNENWKGTSVNDENVSILQEAFAHRAELKSPEATKMFAERSPERRLSVKPIPDRDDFPELPKEEPWEPSHSVSDRSFDMPPPFSMTTDTRDLPHDFFSPHPSLPRRPPPIAHDMPPLITGPVSVTGPLLKTLKSLDHMDSDDDFDHHQDCHHHEEIHPGAGERSLDTISMPQELMSVPTESRGQPAAAPEVQGKDDIPPPLESDGEQSPLTREIHKDSDFPSVTTSEEGSSPSLQYPQEIHAPAVPVHEERSLPAAEIHQESAVPAVHEEQPLPAAEINEDTHVPATVFHEERSLPVTEIHQDKYLPPIAVHEGLAELDKDGSFELHDIPDLEDILPPESGGHESVAVPERPAPMISESHDAAVGQDFSSVDVQQPIASTSVDHTSDSHGPPFESEMPISPAYDHQDHSHSVERSISLPTSEDLSEPESPDNAMEAGHELSRTMEKSHPGEVEELSAELLHTVSLPAGPLEDLDVHQPVHSISIPTKMADHGPSSPDTDIGGDTPEHEKQGGLASRLFLTDRNNSIASLTEDEVDSPHALPVKPLSSFERVSALEALSNSLPNSPSPDTKSRLSERIKALQPTTDEQVSHVSDKLKGFIEDGPSKRFQPDAPQLQITPPSSKISLSPLQNKSLVSSGRKHSLVPPPPARKTILVSSSSEDSSGDDVDLDSDIEVVGSDSDSDFETPIRPGLKLKPPPKLPPKLRDINPVEQTA